ncbi:MAG: flagellar hook-associated protein FlgK [Xanthomonadales bacterium]|jgi:flagellar hook-associated protein 1 FlgK|nr:flagellar hook-associated protein FlgK [Xanthomonadales bacterium]MBN8794797.1 flagellar hook-associated protein FlgK [Stenotrophomonas nitritireducens]
MTSGILGTGTSALLAYQRALSTVSHNVANAATPGYTRQRVELQARPGASAMLSIGQGVDVKQLTRLADGLVFARQNDSAGELGRLNQLSQLASRVDGLMSDSATSLVDPWSSFFNAAKGVVADPTSNPARSQLLASADQLATRFRSVDGQLAKMDDDVDRSMTSKIADANRLASEIADLNRNIISAGGNVSSDLLDARDQRVRDLSRLVGAQTVIQDDGAMNVFTTGGQPLVLGVRASSLATTQDPYRPDRLQLALQTPTGAMRLPEGTVSGELGGLLEFRSRILDPMRAELGRMATAFAQSANAIQNAGIDYNGNPGANLFTLAPPQVAANAGNTGSGGLSASIDAVGALTGQNLILRFDGSSWSAQRADTGEAVAMTGTGTAADPFRVGGMAIVASPGAATGDRFLVSPTDGAAGSLQVAIKDPAGIASAAPLTSRADPANLGDAKVASSAITDAAQFAGFTGATLDFIDATHYTIDGNGPYTYVPGSAIAGNGWSLTLSGTPAAGDSFTLGRTGPRSSDNANARQLAALDTSGVLDGGTTALTTGVTRLASRAGGEASHAQLSLQAQQAIDDQVNAERESLSGVNLDEEAADMLRYQQAYQAAAQVIATADTLFQTLLSVVRR